MLQHNGVGRLPLGALTGFRSDSPAKFAAIVSLGLQIHAAFQVKYQIFQLQLSFGTGQSDATHHLAPYAGHQVTKDMLHFGTGFRALPIGRLLLLRQEPIPLDSFIDVKPRQHQHLDNQHR